MADNMRHTVRRCTDCEEVRHHLVSKEEGALVDREGVADQSVSRDGYEVQPEQDVGIVASDSRDGQQ